MPFLLLPLYFVNRVNSFLSAEHGYMLFLFLQQNLKLLLGCSKDIDLLIIVS